MAAANKSDDPSPGEGCALSGGDVAGLLITRGQNEIDLQFNDPQPRVIGPQPNDAMFARIAHEGASPGISTSSRYSPASFGPPA